MKRILALILVLTLAVFAFAACGSSGDKDEDEYKMSTFKKNLEKAGYETDVTDDEDNIQDFSEGFGLEYDEYKIKQALKAYSSSNSYVFVIECSSEKNAEKLTKELKAHYQELGSGIIQVKNEGIFVLMDYEESITHALKGASSSKEEASKRLDLYEIFSDANYSISTMNAASMEIFFASSGINPSDYSILTASYVCDMTAYKALNVFECSTASKAKALKDALENNVSYNESNYVASAVGNYVLFGNISLVEIVLGY